MARRRKRTPGAWRVERQLIRYVYEYPDITRQELAQRLGQSPAAISLVIRRLINAGWLRESGRAVSLGGRRPVQLRLSAQKALIVGQSLSSDGARTVLVNPDGEVLAQQHTHDIEHPDDTLEILRNDAEKVITEANVQSDQIIGGGIALAGVVWSDTGVATPSIKGAVGKERNYQEILNEVFPNKITVLDHITRARLVWDVYQNPALREQTCMLLEFGYELGCALSMHGTPYRGTQGVSLEIANLEVSPCGRGAPKTARLKDVVSLRCIIQRTQRALEDAGPCLLRDMLGGDVAALNASLIARAAQAGDNLAYRVVNDVSEAVGQAVGMLVTLLRPRTVMLAGQLVTSGLLNQDLVRRIVRLYVDAEVYESLRLTVSESEEWGAANGVAHLVLRKWLDSLAPGKDSVLAEV